MKSAVHACLLMAVSAVIACSNEASATGPEFPSVIPHVLRAPPTGMPTSPVASEDQEPTAEVVSRGNIWTFIVTVPTDHPQNIIVASYFDPDRDLTTQYLHHSRLFFFSGTRELHINVPCGRYQVDVFVGRVEPPEPPVTDNTLVLGRIGRRVCGSPPAPPLPECPPNSHPVDVWAGSLVCGCDEGYALDEAVCVVVPPPVCDVKTGNLSVRKPLGNPAAECRVTGDGVPGPPNDWWVMKCGLDYTVSFTKLNHCDESEHELSHVTGCACPAPQ